MNLHINLAIKLAKHVKQEEMPIIIIAHHVH